MIKKRIWSILAIFYGILINIIGVLFIAGYILEAIVKRAGDPDQSLLFWYLPMLFIGFFGLIIGIVSTGWGINHLKKKKNNDM